MFPKKKLSQLPEKSAADLATELLPLSGANTLDVGCGRGEFTCFLSDRGAIVSGIDPNSDRISVASAHAHSVGLSVGFYEGFAQSLPFANDAFDIVIFSNSLHHVDNEMIPKALAEAERVLSKMGFLYIMEPVPSGGYFNTAQPVGEGIIQGVNLLDAGAHIGVNTVGQSLRNANQQLRSEPPNPQVNVSPWMNTTIGPDLIRRPLEIDESCPTGQQ